MKDGSAAASGEAVLTVTFSVLMPETSSGYPTVLEKTEGQSAQQLSEGLFALMRVNGYLDCGFFFDNDGVLRYEMTADGFALDRMMLADDGFIVSTRDDCSPHLEGTDASTDLYEGAASYVYRYLVDEDAGAYTLESSFAVPYSSIVSNVSHPPGSPENYVVNSGVDGTFGEYDAEGTLIRQFGYPRDMQGYRAFKDDFRGFWFAEE